jgi:hypothetical protein
MSDNENKEDERMDEVLNDEGIDDETSIISNEEENNEEVEISLTLNVTFNEDNNNNDYYEYEDEDDDNYEDNYNEYQRYDNDDNENNNGDRNMNDDYSEIDRIFEEVLLSYITSPSRRTSTPIIMEPPTPTPYYYPSHSTSLIIPQTNHSIMNYRYPPIFENRSNNIRRFNNIFLNRIIDRIVDPFESVLNQSFNEQPSVEKIYDEMNIDSLKYNSIKIEKGKDCCICLDDFTDDDDVSFSKCNHLFHTKCIKEWSTYKTTCPVCRENFE